MRGGELIRTGEGLDRNGVVLMRGEGVAGLVRSGALLTRGEDPPPKSDLAAGAGAAGPTRTGAVLMRGAGAGLGLLDNQLPLLGAL
jgi:hypothetical protein